MTIHRIYGGSTAPRTMACPAWIKRSRDLPSPPTSEAARLGTALHHVLEQCLIDMNLDPMTFSGKKIKGVEITPDLISEKINPSLDDIDELFEKYDLSELSAEMAVDNPRDPDMGGTADVVGVNADGSLLLIGDYKTGDGYMVQAHENEQMLFYAMCFLMSHELPNLKRVVLAITQPSDRRDNSLDIFETTPERISAFTHDYMLAVKDSKFKNPSAAAGDHCRYCPAQALCPEYETLSKLPMTRKHPLSLAQQAQLGEALKTADQLESWIAAVRKLAHEMLERGEVVPGVKLVPKRARRVWSDPRAVERRIKLNPRIPSEQAYKTELKSPAQLEKLCKQHDLSFKELFDEHVSSVSSGTTMAPESDPRPAVSVTPIRQRIADRFK